MNSYISPLLGTQRVNTKWKEKTVFALPLGQHTVYHPACRFCLWTSGGSCKGHFLHVKKTQWRQTFFFLNGIDFNVNK